MSSSPPNNYTPSADKQQLFPNNLLLTPAQVSASSPHVAGAWQYVGDCRHFFAQYQVNGSPSFTGSVVVQGSIDQVNVTDLATATVTSASASGSMSGDFFGPYMRMQSNWTAGSGASVTGSFAVKS